MAGVEKEYFCENIQLSGKRLPSPLPQPTGMSLLIKKTISCQHVDSFTVRHDLVAGYIPRPGDVGIFEVLLPGKNRQIQNPQGNGVHVYEGDLIMAAFGNRYATKMYEGLTPTGVRDEYHLLGRGGVVGELHRVNARAEAPTSLKLTGYAVDEAGNVLNTRYLRHPVKPFDPSWKFPGKVILSVGSTMDSGKTTTAAYLCGGLKKAGFRTAYIKLTGTIFFKDAPFVLDRGADMALDFSYFGFPSTYKMELPELLDLYHSLLHVVAPGRPDFVVMEIADGLLQRETKMLLDEPAFLETIFDVIYSCSDSLGAIAGIQFLRERNIHPFAISGLLTTSPLLVEETRDYVSAPIFNLQELLDGPAVEYLVSRHALVPA